MSTFDTFKESRTKSRTCIYTAPLFQYSNTVESSVAIFTTLVSEVIV